jgi:hypothetical protein
MLCNDKKLIEDLKELKEYTHLLKNMFNNIKRYEEIAYKANQKIDNILYELTGSEFYLPEHMRGKNEN